MANEKEVSYTSTNTYTTVNTLTSKTKNIWIAFHGLGYLSRYFARYFRHLNPEENYIIVPQAPSKYYQGSDFKHVGASWLTKENTIAETQNVLAYVDAVWEAEKPEVMPNFIVMGYSQGVSIASRWLSSRKIQCDYLLLHSGGIPVELKPEDFSFMKPETKVTYLYGNKDPYITEARKTEQQLKGSSLFGKRLQTTVFEGVHEINTSFLQQIATI